MRAVQAATALELLHTATLIQDDTFDGAHVRRGHIATHRVFGKALATLASDWLLVEALRVAAEASSRFHSLLARAVQQMTIAEAQELRPPVLRTLTEARDYVRAVALGKTGALFGAALAGGAVLGGAAAFATESHWTLGRELGLTFQMIDDAKDIFASTPQTGKDVQQDMSSGRLTAPILLAFEMLEGRPGFMNLNLLLNKRLTRKHRQLLLELLHSESLQQYLRREIDQRCTQHDNDARQLKLGPELTAFLRSSVDTVLACRLKIACDQSITVPSGVSYRDCGRGLLER